MKKLKVFECFAGYGSQSLALNYLGIPIECVGFSEIEPKAIEAYNILHPNVTNFGDITKIKVKKLPQIDIFTYSFPCQAVSVCGKQEGLKEGSGTTSSLLWETFKIIKHKRPTYLMMENVAGLVNKRNKPDFERWCTKLAKLGYINYWDILDAADFGVPQHRERVIMISVLKEYDKDYQIPKFYNNKKRKKVLSDILEDSVDSKYNLKSTYLNTYTITENIKKGRVIKKLGTISPTYGRGNAGGIYDISGLSPTIIAGCGSGGNNVPHIRISNSSTNASIRRLTPIECLRLQGVRDKDINKLVESGLFSDTTLYKLAGNSIAIPVLFKVFKDLLI